MGVRTRRTIGMGALALLWLTGLSACSDDEETPQISLAEYEQNAAELCADQGTAIEEPGQIFDRAANSDAEVASFLVAEFIPRVRAVLRGVLRAGLPPERAAEYQEGISLAIEGLNDLQDAPYSWIDRTRAGTILPEEDGMRKVIEGMEAAGLGDC